MLNTTARIVSVVAHPLVMPVVATLFLFYTDTPWALLSSHYKTASIIAAATGTSLFPLTIIGILIAFEVISDIEMPTQRERFVPMLCTCLCMGCSLIAAQHALPHKLPEPIVGLIMGEFLMLLLTTIITPIWKISLHAMSLGALLIFVVFIGMLSHANFLQVSIIVFAITGIVAWARLYVNAHNSAQLLGGYLLGALSMLLALTNTILGL